MQFVIDHLVSLIVGAVIFTILVALRLQDQRNVVELTASYSMRNQQIGFIEMLERDMMGVYRVNAVPYTKTSGTAGFTVHTRVLDKDQNPLDLRVTYEAKLIETRADGTKLYQIERWVGPPVAGVAVGKQAGDKRSGASPPTVTTWNFGGRSIANGSCTSLPSCEKVYVAFETALQETKASSELALNRTRFESTFTPPTLGGIPQL